MSEITRGRKKGCKGEISGVKSIRLIRYSKYDNESIILEDGVLVSFPESIFFKWQGEDISFEENGNDDDGYTQEVEIRLPKKDLDTLRLVSSLLGGNVRVIVETRSGVFKMLGLYSGLEVEINGNSGTTHESFSGYEVSFSGLEEFESPYIENFTTGKYYDGDISDRSCLLSSSNKLSSTPLKSSDCNVVA